MSVRTISLNALRTSLVIDKHSSVAPAKLVLGVMRSIWMPAVSFSLKARNALSKEELFQEQLSECEKSAVSKTVNDGCEENNRLDVADSKSVAAHSSKNDVDAENDGTQHGPDSECTQQKGGTKPEDEDSSGTTEGEVRREYIVAVEVAFKQLCELFVSQLRRIIYLQDFEKLWLQLLQVFRILLNEKEFRHGTAAFAPAASVPLQEDDSKSQLTKDVSFSETRTLPDSGGDLGGDSPASDSSAGVGNNQVDKHTVLPSSVSLQNLSSGTSAVSKSDEKMDAAGSSIQSTACKELKNILIITIVTGIFQDRPRLWQATCDYIHVHYNYCPNILESLLEDSNTSISPPLESSHQSGDSTEE